MASSFDEEWVIVNVSKMFGEYRCVNVKNSKNVETHFIKKFNHC
jgi:hypothetical protein